MAADPQERGLVLVAYDGTPAAEHAVREAGAVFAGRSALVVTVWKEGLGYEFADDPALIGVAPAPIDVSSATAIDDVVRERAQRTAQHGADIAAEAGFARAEGLTVADEVDRSVPDSILRVADERGAQVIVVGAHTKGRLSALIVGSTSRDLLKRATRPVLVVREAPASD